MASPAVGSTATLGPTSGRHNESAIYMDTLVSVEVVCDEPDRDVRSVLRRALNWFGEVEAVCSRFDETSELVALCRRPGEAVVVSGLLFRVLQVAFAVARASGGAFDPTVGETLRRAGFDRDHRTGIAVPAMPHAPGADYRDIALDSGAGTVTLRRPLSLDLGAVAKGFAIDLAAAELRPLRDFAVNAGGDVYVGGLNAEQQPWRIGIRDPRDPRSVVKVLRVSDAAVCTSGDYERRSDRTGGHHIVDPGTGVSAGEVASVTVVAPTAALADALATAAFVLGPSRGRRFLERSGVEGLILTSEGKSIATAGIEGMSE